MINPWPGYENPTSKEFYYSARRKMKTILKLFTFLAYPLWLAISHLIDFWESVSATIDNLYEDGKEEGQ